MIVIVYSGFLDRGFGVRSHVMQLRRSLAEAGHEADVLSLDSVPAPLRFLPHVTQAALNLFAPPFGHYARYRLGARLLRRRFGELACSGRVAAVIFEDIYNYFPVEAPAVCVLHALQTDNLQSFRIPARLRALAERYDARRIESCPYPVVTVSEPYKRAITEKLRPYWSDPHEIGVIPLGTRLPGVSARRPSPLDGLRLVYVGSLEARKNLAFLLEVSRRLRARSRVRFTMTLIGDGPERPRLEAQVKALGLDGRVVFTGKIGHEQVLGALGDYHSLLHPSLKESFGYTLLEAKLAGLTVMATEGLEVPSEFVDVALPLDPGRWVEEVERMGTRPAGVAEAEQADRIAALREQYDPRRMTELLLARLGIPKRERPICAVSRAS